MINMKKIIDKLKKMGPGFVWAIAAIGSGELIISTKAGAEYGFAFIWILWLGVFIDFWLQRGIMEVTILTGKPVTRLWEEKKWGKWISIFWLIYFVIMIGGLAGLLGLATAGLSAIVPFSLFNIWPVLIILLSLLVFFKNQYRFFEKIMLFFGAILVIGVITTIILAPPNIQQVFSWELPVGGSAFLVFLALLGWSAGSGPELMIPYSGWLLKKKKISEIKKDSGFSKIKEYLKVMRWDALGGFLSVGIIASVFLAAGATILKPRGSVLDGFSVVNEVSLIFTEIFGPWSFWLFVVPITIAFVAASLGIFNGCCSSIINLIRGIFSKNGHWDEEKRKSPLGISVALIFGLAALGIFFFVPNPVILVAVAGATSALATPVLTIFIIWGLLRKVPKEFRPGKFYLSFLVVGTIIHIIIIAEAILRFVR